MAVLPGRPRMLLQQSAECRPGWRLRRPLPTPRAVLALCHRGIGLPDRRHRRRAVAATASCIRAERRADATWDCSLGYALITLITAGKGRLNQETVCYWRKLRRTAGARSALGA